MNISIPLNNGVLPDKYGKYSSEKLRKYGNNINSFPITISEVPAGTKSLAFTFIDYDSTPVCGFTWIHWLACDIDPKVEVIPENASQEHRYLFTQGMNSTFSRPEETGNDSLVMHGYIGPCPPDKDHTYTLKMYALDTALKLKEGYFLNDFHWAIKGHVLDTATLDFISRA